MRKERGITLIALIITIIILLLLAGVALNALSGEYGILKEAQYAVDKYNEEVVEEQTILDSINQWLNQQQAEPVYAKVYDMGDDGYHLVFNKTGNVAQGYTADQVVYETENITNGFVEDGWDDYERYIKKAIIEEKIKPISIAYYFYGLRYMTEIVNLNNIDTSNVTDMSYMFSRCANLENINLSNFDTSNVTTMEGMFASCSSLTEIDLSNFNTKNVTNMSYMFVSCWNLSEIDVSGFDTSNVTIMEGIFANCEELKTIDLSNFNTKNVTNMSYMFASCCNLSEIDVSGFDTSKVTNMSYMFGTEDYYYPMYSLTEIKGLNKLNTSNVTDMSGMFANCFALESVDLTSFNTSKVTTMKGMFASCCSLTEIDVSGFDTSNVTNMSYMFGSMSSWDVMENLTEIIGIETLNTSNVTTMKCMFTLCVGLTSLNISNFDTSKVTDMWAMFAGCENLVTIYVSEKWSTEALTSSSWMFDECTSLVGAISYDFKETDGTYANYTNGYLTYKASE